MLLPIVLLLAAAAPTQQAADVVPAAQQFSITEQNHGAIEPGPNRFVNPGPMGSVRRFRSNRISPDNGMIIAPNPCLGDGACQAVCAHITAYVFSDGENPELQYVTDCPNLDAPNQTERARRNLPKNQQQPDLKRTKN